MEKSTNGESIRENNDQTKGSDQSFPSSTKSAESIVNQLVWFAEKTKLQAQLTQSKKREEKLIESYDKLLRKAALENFVDDSISPASDGNDCGIEWSLNSIHANSLCRLDRLLKIVRKVCTGNISTESQPQGQKVKAIMGRDMAFQALGGAEAVLDARLEDLEAKEGIQQNTSQTVHSSLVIMTPEKGALEAPVDDILLKQGQFVEAFCRQDSLDVAKSRTVTLEAGQAELDTRVKSFESELCRLRKSLETANACLETANAEKAVLEVRVTDFMAEEDRLKQLIGDAESRQAATNREKVALQARVEELESEEARFCALLTASETSLAAICTENSDLKARMEGFVSGESHLHSLLDVVESSAAVHMSAQTPTLNARVERLVSEKGLLVQALESAQLAEASLRLRAESLESAIASLRFDLKTLKAEKEKLEARVSSLVAEEARLRVSLQTAESSLSASVEEKEALVAHVGALEAEETKLRLSLAAAESSIAFGAAEKTAMEKQVEDLVIESGRVRLLLEEIESLTVALKVEKEALGTRVAGLISEKDNLQQALEVADSRAAAVGSEQTLLTARVLQLESAEARLELLLGIAHAPPAGGGGGGGAAAVATVAGLETAKMTCEARIQHLLSEESRLRVELEAAEATVGVENAEKARLQARVDEMMTEEKRIRSLLETAESLGTGLTADKAALEGCVRQLSANGDDLRLSLQAAQVSVESLAVEKAALEGRVEHLIEEQSGLRLSLEAAELEAVAMRAEKLEFRGQVGRLESDKARFSLMLDVAKSSSAALNAEKSQLESRLHRVESAKRNLQASLEAAKTTESSLAAEKAALRSSVERLEFDKAQLQSLLLAAEANAATLSAEKATLESRIKKLDFKNFKSCVAVLISTGADIERIGQELDAVRSRRSRADKQLQVLLHEEASLESLMRSMQRGAVSSKRSTRGGSLSVSLALAPDSAKRRGSEGAGRIGFTDSQADGEDDSFESAATLNKSAEIESGKKLRRVLLDRLDSANTISHKESAFCNDGNGGGEVGPIDSLSSFHLAAPCDDSIAATHRDMKEFGGDLNDDEIISIAAEGVGEGAGGGAEATGCAETSAAVSITAEECDPDSMSAKRNSVADLKLLFRGNSVIKPPDVFHEEQRQQSKAKTPTLSASLSAERATREVTGQGNGPEPGARFLGDEMHQEQEAEEQAKDGTEYRQLPGWKGKQDDEHGNERDHQHNDWEEDFNHIDRNGVANGGDEDVDDDCQQRRLSDMGEGVGGDDFDAASNNDDESLSTISRDNDAGNDGDLDESNSNPLMGVTFSTVDTSFEYHTQAGSLQHSTQKSSHQRHKSKELSRDVTEAMKRSKEAFDKIKSEPKDDIWWTHRSKRLPKLKLKSRRTAGQDLTMTTDSSGVISASALTTEGGAAWTGSNSRLISTEHYKDVHQGMSKVCVQLISGDGLLACDLGTNTSNPFALVWLGDPAMAAPDWSDIASGGPSSVLQSKTCFRVVSPVWNEPFIFPLQARDPATVSSLQCKILVRHDAGLEDGSASCDGENRQSFGDTMSGEHRSGDVKNLGLVNIELRDCLRRSRVMKHSLIDSARKYSLTKLTGGSVGVKGFIVVTVSVYLTDTDAALLHRNLLTHTEPADGRLLLAEHKLGEVMTKDVMKHLQQFAQREHKKDKLK